MPRRNHSTRRRPAATPPFVEPQPSPQQLAALLVARGLASPRILGPVRNNIPDTTSWAEPISDERNT
jgi:hypothetical protein